MKKLARSAIAIVILAAGLHAQPPATSTVKLEGSNTTPRIANGKLEQQPVSGSLSATVQQIGKSATAPLWIGYAVPAEGTRPHLMCCFDNESGGTAGCCSGCRLETSRG